MIYLSGPLTPLGGRTIDQNVDAAVEVYLRFVRAGIAAHCPHLGGYHDEFHAIDYETWMAYDLAVLEGCSGLLKLPDWETSRGSVREVAHAITLGIPVFDSEARAIAFARQSTGSVSPRRTSA